jgi:hypothetical protein
MPFLAGNNNGYLAMPVSGVCVALHTAIVSAWTSKPKYRNFSFMTGSLPPVALDCGSF